MQLKNILNLQQGLQIKIKNRLKNKVPNSLPYITIGFLKKESFEYYIKNPKKNHIVYPNELLIVRTGLTGKPIIGIKGVYHNNFFKVINDQNKLLNKYLYFWVLKNEKNINNLGSGTTIKDLSHKIFLNINIIIPKISCQQRIIDIIEPFEKLAEIYEKLIKLINNLFSLITKLYSLQTKEKLLSYFNFIKGTEISSSKRTKNIENKLVKYIRVEDLTFNSERQSLYCTKDNNFFFDYQDILLATDGDPGRIMTGLNGVFSSSIRKVIPKTTNQHLSIALLNLLNPINKEIFNAYTTGTTIKHGGNNAIKNLKYFEYDKHIKILVKSLYENLTTLQNNLTKVIFIKKLLINKLIE
ncbi:restriction endonuclease subunit S [Spiroplasma endosymbiont of Polydrusus pterygomalis]|uniref:restriction endonuclease subunit S n=1 Tax=Spiroplasma endosymbiont of Polydrusus pterygomalis TaxID=3139327 RepID=UPI003CCAE784